MNKPIEEKDLEVEDFQKEITFESGQFAIVDAEVAKALKDKVPLAEKAVFVATKQARGQEITFSVKAEYDDARLKRLVIEPTTTGEVQVIDGPESVEEAALPGINHEGGRVEKVISKINRKAGGPAPKTGDRAYRNKGDSAMGNPLSKLTTGGSVEKRVEKKMALDGGRRNNYGQPRSKKKRKSPKHTQVETECFELLDHVKNKTLNESFIQNMQHCEIIHKTLADMRTGEQVNGKDYDLIFEAVEILDKHHDNDAQQRIDGVLRLING